jgi:hypothetical protein
MTKPPISPLRGKAPQGDCRPDRRNPWESRHFFGQVVLSLCRDSQRDKRGWARGEDGSTLPEFGFEIESYKNAEKSDYEKTIVIDNGENPEFAQRVSSIIRCKLISTRTEDLGPSSPKSL